MTRPLSTGIFGIVGDPGSGKSYKVVKMMADEVIYHHRPVVTNIPVKMRRMRAYIYLKSSGTHRFRRNLAKLIRPMTKQHFDRFAARLSMVSECVEKLKDEHEWSDGDDMESLEDEFWHIACAAVEKELGPPKTSGRHADWLLPGTVMCMDELHKWYPSKDYKDEPKYILDLTSMHRHLQLKLYVISQRWMNVSLSFRSMAVEVLRCMNWARMPLLGPLKLHEFGFNVFRYSWVPKSEYDERTGELKIGCRESDVQMEWPELLGRRVIYSLYRSQVHGGSIEEQNRELDAARRSLGIYQEESDMGKAKKRFGWVALGVAAALGFIVGGVFMSGGRDREQPEPVAQQGRPAAVQAAAAGDMREPFELVRVTGVTGDSVFVGNDVVRIGDDYETLRLVHVDAAGGRSYWLDPRNRVVSWSVGSYGRYGMLPDDVREQVRARLGRAEGVGVAGAAAPAADVDAAAVGR